MSGGGRFDFDDGGTYCGGWEDGKAHGYGVCTGPKGQGEYSGAWQYGFEISGIYTWPSGNCFEGQWMQGKRHGLGIEKKGKWIYRGEWTQGFKGRYGARQSSASGAKYEGTWTTGLQDGSGVETYADGGTYQGQWLRGMRHGYGVRQSVPYGMAAHYRGRTQRASLTSIRSEQEDDFVVKDRDRKVDEGRGGFVLQARSDVSPSSRRRSIFDKHGRSSIRNSLIKGLKLKKQKSTGDIHESPRRPTGSVRSTASNVSHASAESAQSAVSNVTQYTDSNQSFVSQDDIADVNVTEIYMGEWKNDKRSGFGVSERTDGLKYEGEWYNNKKFGYGVTTHKDGSKEEGKYKNNVLVSSGKKSKFIIIRSSKMKERVENAVTAAQKAATIALQKADIAIARMSTARTKAEAADEASLKSKEHSDLARIKAKEVAPEFHQPGTDLLKKHLEQHGGETDMSGIVPTPVTTTLGRSQTLAMKRQGSAGNGSIGSSPNELKLMANHNPAPKFNTLPRNTSITKEEVFTPISQAVSYKAPPLVGNHVSPRTPQNVSWPNSPEMENTQPLYSSSNRMTPTKSNLPMQPNGRPPTQRLSTMHMGESIDHVADARDGINLGNDFDIPPPQEPYMDRRSEDRYSVDRYSEHSQGAQNQNRTSNKSFSDLNSSTNSLRTRRKTLPSIVHNKKSIKIDPKAKNKPNSNSNKASKPLTPIPTTRDDIMDTYVIENGVRKRIKAEVVSYPRPPSPSPSVTSVTSIEEKPKQLPEVYKLEPTNLSASRNRGSLPDVRKDIGVDLMPRAEVSALSHARRNELRRMREEEEARKNMEIVLSVADVKEWCQQRQMLILIVALNVGLATMFFNLLH